jgi:hypothetical protein
MSVRSRHWILSEPAESNPQPVLLKCILIFSDLHLVFPGDIFPSDIPVVYMSRGQDSSVGIVTGYGLNDRGVGVRVHIVSRIFPRRPDRLWGPPNQPTNRGLLSPGREADHSPPASAKVKIIFIYTSTPPYASMAYNYR